MSDAKILLYDIESAPNRAWVWGKYDQNVLAFDQEWFLLSFAWKWLGESTVHVLGLDDFPKDFKKDPTDDRRLVEKLHELFTEADIVVAHNGNSFDNKKVHARMLVHGYDPPEPYQQVDTCLVARRYFNFNSNSLKDLANTLGLPPKGDPGGISTWLSCMAGDEKAWKSFKKYNKQDVTVLEEIYLRLRPWIDGHPAVSLISGELEACPKCGGRLTHQGYRQTKTMTYKRYQCQDCGGWSRSRTSEKGPKPMAVS